MDRRETLDLSGEKRPPSSENKLDIDNPPGPRQISEGFSQSQVNLEQANIIGNALECDLARLAKVFEDVREKRPATSNRVQKDESSALVEPAHRLTDVKTKNDESKNSGDSHSKQALHANLERV